MDLLDLQRLITALLLPVPVGLGLVSLGLLFIALHGMRGRALPGIGLVLGGVVVLLLTATPRIADAWMGWLEAGYRLQLPEHCPSADAIVLLGGAMRPQVAGDVRGRLHNGSDRVWEAARLYHAGCAPVLLISAGGRLETPWVGSESDAIESLLLELGVPAEALLLEDESRNTQGNAAFSREALAAVEADQILLVTSAWHLRRAVPLFEREGLVVLPWAADPRSLARCRGAHCWVPDAEALHRNGLAWKETLGYWVQIRRF